MLVLNIFQILEHLIGDFGITDDVQPGFLIRSDPELADR